MEHRFVFAVFTKEGNVLAQIHILEAIRHEASITTLDALAKLFEYLVVRLHYKSI